MWYEKYGTSVFSAIGDDNPEAAFSMGIGRDVINLRNREYDAPLHYACVQGAAISVRVLLSKRASVHVVDHDGVTPLHLAVAAAGSHQMLKQGYREIIEMLLEVGANPCAKAANGATPLKIAAGSRSPEVFNILQECIIGRLGKPPEIQPLPTRGR